MPASLAPLLALALAAAPLRPAPAAPEGDGGRHVSAQAIGHYLGARQAEADGDLARALEELRLALVFDDGSPQIRVARAEVLAQLDRLHDAEREAQRAVALAPEGEEAADAWLLIGQIAVHRHDLARATGALRTAAALEVRLAAARGPDEDQTPDPEAWSVLARAQLEGGDEQGAAATWADLGKVLPAEGARGYRRMARTYLDGGDAARGGKYLRAAVALYPGDRDAWKLLAQLADRRDDAAEARTDWEGALRAEPEDTDALAALGRLSARAGDVAGAQAYFRQLRLLEPDDAGAAVAEAVAWVDARRPEDALTRLHAYDGAPDPRVPFARGLALEALKRWPDAAAAYFLVGTDAGDLWVDAQVNGAHALAQAGRPAEAVALLGKALQRRPRDEGLLFARGVAEERAGNTDAALAQMKALLAIAPDHAEALNFVGYTYAERGVHLDEAERLLGRALELRPGNGFFLDSLGWIYFRKGELARALQALERADAAAGAEPTILEHLGDAYRRAQRGADAERAYRRALSTLDAGGSDDGPERTARQRAGLERKLRELGGRAGTP